MYFIMKKNYKFNLNKCIKKITPNRNVFEKKNHTLFKY